MKHLATILLLAFGLSFSTAQTVEKRTDKVEKKSVGVKLKKDGTPDKRYKQNKKLKKDGTPDRRYKQNKSK